MISQVLSLPNPEMMTDADMAIHEEFAARSLDDFRSDMIQPRSVGRRNDFEMGVIDIRQSDEADGSRAVIVPLPFGNPYSEAMDIRVRAITAFAPEDTRVLVVPNNTRQERYYSFKGVEQNDGVETLGNYVLKACVELGIREIAIAGYSQGASVGASMIRDASSYDIDVRAAYLGDPANVVERTAKQLKKDFMGTGLGNLNRGINDSAVPALSEVQHSRGGLDAVRQLIMFAGVARNGSMPENVALHESMTGNGFVRQLDQAVQEGFDVSRLTVVRMSDSKVCPVDTLVSDMGDLGLGDNVNVVDGYGHEGGDNVIDNALRVREALVQAGFWQR